MASSSVGLTAQQLEALRKTIRARLEEEGAQEKIREIANESIEKMKADNSDQIQPHKLLDDFKKTGILETILTQLNESRTHLNVSTSSGLQQRVELRPVTSNKTLHSRSIDPQKRYLYIHLHGGKAFTGQAPSEVYSKNQSTLSIHVSFMKQRFVSNPVSSSLEPSFEDSFLLALSSANEPLPQNGKSQDLGSLLSLADHIHLLVLEQNANNGHKTVISSQFIEWRHLLMTTGMKERTALPLYGVGNESKIVVGVLDITMEIVPHFSSALQKEVVHTQFEIEQSRLNERSKAFFNYAKHWWKEYLQVRSENSAQRKRLVKMFGQDENGVTRSVCSFVRVLRAGRVIDSPLHAARFVSLLSPSRDQSNPSVTSDDSSETWQSLLCTLVQNRGNGSADLANLLCSIYIGFGLNAYVCYGTKSGHQAHSWVCVISPDESVVFYEASTGHKFIHDPIQLKDGPLQKIQPRNNYPYVTVGCVYNNREFYANIQPSDRVMDCTFDVLNESKWKPMDRQVLDSTCGPDANTFWKNTPLLASPTLNTVAMCDQLEVEMMDLIADYRRNKSGMETVFDAGLGYILQSALSSYEMERTLGVSVGAESFQSAIRQYIPDGETFKGCPLHLAMDNARDMFAVCLKSSSCEEILSCRGDKVRLAIRAKIVAFPENVVSVWIMLACKYRAIL